MHIQSLHAPGFSGRLAHIRALQAWYSQELRELLRERYPEGLTTSRMPEKTTPIPDENTHPVIAYAVLNIPNDRTRGWKRLSYGDESTKVLKAGLKQNGIVAFTFLQDPDDEAGFEVEWPRDEEEYYDDPNE